MTESPLVFVDVETTGLLPGRQAWEIGMIRRADTEPAELSFYVDVDIRDAEADALAVGRYYERHPAGRALSGLPDLGDDVFAPADAARIVHSWTYDAAVVLGCTVNFDTETLEPLLRRFGLAPRWDYHLLDVTTYAAGQLGIARTGPPPFKSRTIAALLGVTQPEHEAHTALGDAHLARRIYDATIYDARQSASIN